MTAIASYYASVGVGIDPNSLQNVQRYLDTIQAKMVKFQKDSTSFNSVPIKLNSFSVNQASLRKALNAAISTTSDGKVGGITLSNFNVSRSAIRTAVNSAINTASTGEAAPGIKLSRFVVSRTDIRSAIANAINSTSMGKEGAGIVLNNFSVNRASLRNSINSAVANQRVRLDNVTVGNIRVSGPSVAKQINAAIGTNTKGSPRTYNVGVDLKTFRVDSGALSRAINNALRTTSTDPKTAIRLRNFHASQKDVVAAINRALNVHGSTSRIRIGALLSQSSLTEMRNQIRQAINQLVVNPTINPRVRVTRTGVVQGQGVGGSEGGGTRPNRFTTRDPRSMNPWHNPMMIGGSAGAFMRYGMFSLPFVAGAYGLNALSQNMTRLEGHNIMLTTSTQSPVVAREQFDVVNRISEGLGLKTSDILPFYAQMFAGARGTTLEQELPSSFQGFMEYAMAMGVNDQQLEGGIRAISQAISKGAIYSEEWRQQLTCVVMIMQAVVKPI